MKTATKKAPAKKPAAKARVKKALSTLKARSDDAPQLSPEQEKAVATIEDFCNELLGDD